MPVNEMWSRCVVGVRAALPPVTSGSRERTASPEAGWLQASDSNPVLLGNFPNQLIHSHQSFSACLRLKGSNTSSPYTASFFFFVFGGELMR